MLKILDQRKQLLNVHNASDVRQIEVHTAEPLIYGPGRPEVEIANSNLKNYKSPVVMKLVVP
jgi:hypothetical protein